MDHKQLVSDIKKSLNTIILLFPGVVEAISLENKAAYESAWDISRLLGGIEFCVDKLLKDGEADEK